MNTDQRKTLKKAMRMMEILAKQAGILIDDNASAREVREQVDFLIANLTEMRNALDEHIGAEDLLRRCRAKTLSSSGAKRS